MNLTSGIVLLGVAMWTIADYSAGRVARSLSGSLTDQIIAKTEVEIESFFGPVATAIEMVLEAARADLLTQTDTEKLDRFFSTLLTTLPQVVEAHYADFSGNDYLLRRAGDKWESRIIKPSGRGNQARWRVWTDMRSAPTESWRESDYDVHRRPWFRGAIEQLTSQSPDTAIEELVHWTDPYALSSSDAPGVTTSVAAHDSEGNGFVVGLNVLLADLSAFALNVSNTEPGLVFVLYGDPWIENQLVIVGAPTSNGKQRGKSADNDLLKYPAELGGPLAAFTRTALGNNHGPPDDPIAFESDGRPWWGAIKRSRLDSEHELWLATLIPEDELLAGLPPVRLIVLAVTALVMLLAIWRSAMLARSYGKPIDSLANNSRRMQRLSFQPGDAVKSNVTEIQVLANAMERMRKAMDRFSSVREDLRIAESIRDMSTPAAFADDDRLQVSVWRDFDQESGGQGYDVYRVDRHDDQVGLLCYDISGSGVPASVIGAQLSAVFRSGLRASLGPVEIVEQLERLLHEDSRLSHRGALWCAMLHTDSGELRNVNAGYRNVYRYRAVDRVFAGLGPAGAVYDDSDREPGWSIRCDQLDAGDLVVLASESLIGSLNEAREPFGVESLESLARAEPGGTADDLVSTLRESLCDYTTRTTTDRSVMVIKYLGTRHR